MNTHGVAHAGLTTAQETVQTVLLIIVSVIGTWLSLYRIPWHVSGDPCLIAAAGTWVIVACLWLTRWRGSRAVIFERNLLAGFLVAMPLVYVLRYLFASAGRVANYWFWIEVLGTAIFAALAVFGVKRSPWFLAVGMVLHGLVWDTGIIGTQVISPTGTQLPAWRWTSHLVRTWLRVSPHTGGHRALRRKISTQGFAPLLMSGTKL